MQYRKLNSSNSAHPINNGTQSETQSNDLTLNFLQNAQTFQKGTKRTTNQEIYSQDSFFNKSSRLREKIRRTGEQINELRSLQKSSGLFNNEENKMNELMFVIGDNIGQIQSGIQDLEMSSPDMCIRQSRAGHSAYKAIIEIMQSQLMKITEMFKKDTTKRLEVMSQQQQSTPFLSGTSQVERRIRNKGAQFLPIKNTFSEDIEGGSNGEEIKYKMINYKEKEHSQVSESMKYINNQLQSVFEMFKKIGSMVQMHETLIERIDQNTDQAAINLEKGKSHLVNTHRNVTSTRGMIIKIFIMMMILSFLYIVFLL